MSDAECPRLAEIDPDRIRDRLVELVRIPSLGAHEEAAITRVAEWLSDLGAEVDLWYDDAFALQRRAGYPGHEIPRSTVPVVAARLRGARPGPAVLLTGHLDVVPSGDLSQWSLDPYSGLEQDGRIYGRGACDMKSGVVAGIEVLEAFARGPRDFAGQVIYVGVPGEEDSGIGTFSAIERGWWGDVAIISEPTSVNGRPTLVTAHAGCLSITIQVTGRSAHASKRLNGESAFEHYLKVHEALRADERRLNEAEDDPRMKDLELPYATNIGLVQGGVFPSSVMDTLRADLRIGVSLSETIQDAEARVRGVVAEACRGDAWLEDHPPEVQVVSSGFGSAGIDPNHGVVEAIDGAAREVLGVAPVRRAAPYGCDMAGWIRLGNVPTVLYGPGDIDLAHGPDEWVSLQETVDVARVLTRATDQLLHQETPEDGGGAQLVGTQLPPHPPQSG